MSHRTRPVNEVVTTIVRSIDPSLSHDWASRFPSRSPWEEKPCRLLLPLCLCSWASACDTGSSLLAHCSLPDWVPTLLQSATLSLRCHPTDDPPVLDLAHCLKQPKPAWIAWLHQGASRRGDDLVALWPSNPKDTPKRLRRELHREDESRRNALGG